MLPRNRATGTQQPSTESARPGDGAAWMPSGGGLSTVLGKKIVSLEETSANAHLQNIWPQGTTLVRGAGAGETAMVGSVSYIYI